MTDETPVGSRGLFNAETEYDTVRLDITREEQISPRTIKTYLDGRLTATMHGYSGPLFDLIDRRFEAGEITVEFDTPLGTFRRPNVPDWIRTYVDLRDPFRRKVNTILTLVEQRRKDVEVWAVANTDWRLMAKAAVTGKTAATGDALTGRRRNVGQIWWGFVLHTLAAAQHDPWLEHHDVWPAIEHNITIDGHTFVKKASANVWNEVAGYFEAYSRIYKAPEMYLTSAPTQVHVIGATPPVQETLSAGADEARRIVYGSA